MATYISYFSRLSQMRQLVFSLGSIQKLLTEFFLDEAGLTLPYTEKAPWGRGCGWAAPAPSPPPPSSITPNEGSQPRP